MSDAVRVERLAVRYGERAVLGGLDLAVARGETLAVLGASGCGKSTLLRAIAGLVAPHAGTVRVDGEVGVVFQEPRLMPWLTVERNVAFAARNAAERARVREVIALVGLERAAAVLPKALSGGMAQRAALARALVRSPQVLLLDEPLSALDALLRMELQTALARIVADTGCTAVLVTHDVDEALYLADRIAVLEGAPARAVRETVVPPGLRRDRTAPLANERTKLLRALGVETASTPPREQSRDAASLMSAEL